MKTKIVSLVMLVLLSVPCVSKSQTLKVTLLGTGVPVPSIERFGPATLVQAGEEKLLFDVGRGATIRLSQLGIPLGQLSAVFISHHHSDHTAGLADLFVTGQIPMQFGQRVTPLELYGPEGTEEMAINLQAAWKIDTQMRINEVNVPIEGTKINARDHEEGLLYDKNGVRVIAFEVDHTETTFGYRVEYQDKVVVISSDTRPTENLVENSDDVDLLIHEVVAVDSIQANQSPLFKKIISGHTTLDQAGDIFNRVKPEMAVYTHIIKLYPISDQQMLDATRKNYPGPLLVGSDLMQFLIGETVEVESWPYAVN